MGYRTYIGVISKNEYNKIKSLNKKELYKHYGVTSEQGYIGVNDFTVKLYEFGKYTDFNPPKGSVKNFFKNKPLESYYNSDTELKVVNKDFLKYVIESYTESIKIYYNEMVMPFLSDGSEFLESVKTDYDKNDENYKFDFTKIKDDQQTAFYDIIQHVKSLRLEWLCVPYNLDSGDEITKSWKYEYVIFELIRIYKSFDWDRNIMVYYGS